jgi:hypothetical protein
MSWNAIKKLGWKRNKYDDEKCAVTLKQFPVIDQQDTAAFFRERVADLYGAIKKWEEKNPRLSIGSDDGLSDVLSHIVGLGESEFNQCIKNPLLIEARYNSKYGSAAGYTESFSYTFLDVAKSPAPIRPVGLCHKCVHGFWAKDALRDGRSSTFMGCSEDSRINWANHNDLCPLLKKVEKRS